MRQVIRWSLAMSAIFATACASAPAPVPLLGTERAIARLAGTWQGEYASEQTGRSGVVAFTLKAATDSAFGEVVMYDNRGSDERNESSNDVGGTRARSMTPLRIRFVQSSGREVHGELDPYADPRCGCTLRTRFVGTVDADAIQGTFSSEGSAIFHQPTHGTWRVVRVAGSPRAPNRGN